MASSSKASAEKQEDVSNGSSDSITIVQTTPRVPESHVMFVPILPSQTTLGMKARNGVVIALSAELPFIEPVRKILPRLVQHTSIATVALLAKIYSLMLKNYHESQNCASLTNWPVLVGGFDNGGPQLHKFEIENRVHDSLEAVAFGQNAKSANSILLERYTEGLGVENAIDLALFILKRGILNISALHIVVGIVGSDRKCRFLSTSEIYQYLQRVQ